MNKEEQLKKEFDAAIDKMIGEWNDNADKAKEYKDGVTIKNEYIKVNIAKVIKTVYKVKYNQVYGGK